MGRTLDAASATRMEAALEEALGQDAPVLAHIAKRHGVVRQTLSYRYHRARGPRARTVAPGESWARTPPDPPAPGAEGPRISSSDADPFADIPQAPAEEVFEGEVVGPGDVPDDVVDGDAVALVSDEEIRRRIPEVRGVGYAVAILTRGVLKPGLDAEEREAFEYNGAGMLVETGWRIPFIITFPLTCLGITVPRIEALVERFVGAGDTPEKTAPRAQDGEDAPDAGNVRVREYRPPDPPTPPAPPASRGADGKAHVTEYEGGADGPNLAGVEQLS